MIAVVTLALVLTLLELFFYRSFDFIAGASGDIAPLVILAMALLAFDLLTAVYVARAFPVQRFRKGVTVAALVWGMQLSLLVVLVWLTNGPPVFAEASVWTVAVFGWWYTGIVSVPLIGVLAACVGWVVDKSMRRGAGARRTNAPVPP